LRCAPDDPRECLPRGRTQICVGAKGCT
jgi:hypothetical protein